MTTIWKFHLDITGYQEIQMPDGYFLTAQMQRDELVLWAEVNTDSEQYTRSIYIFGTGHPMPDKELYYIATVQQSDGLVWHIFEGAIEEEDDKRTDGK